MMEQHPYCSRPLLAPTMGPAGSGLDKYVEQGRCDQGEDVGN
jgi:hypothetical protein